MPLVVADRVRETTTTTGTGTVTLAGAVTGYQSFSAIGNGNTTYYTINAGSQWEVGIGTYTGAGPSLSRDTVLESSNSGSLVDFAAGTKDVFVTYPAEKSISDGYGLLPIANGGTNATTAANALTNLGAYPASNPSGYTSNTGTVTSVDLTAGTGISVSGGPVTSSGSITVTNTAPDQVVSLTGAGTTSISGTYPNFTITSNDSTVGTVTSVGGTGTVNGITLTGSVTASGNLTLGGTLSGVNLTSQVTGTLPVANGGTGATSLTSGYLVKGNGTSAASASVVYDDGTKVGIGTSSPTELLTLDGGVFAVTRYAASGAINMQRAEGTQGSPTAITAAINVSLFNFRGYDGAAYRTVAHITASAEAAVTPTSSPGNLLFRTTPSGSVTPLTRMRILSSGNVGIGTDTPTSLLHVAGALTLDTALSVANGGTGATTLTGYVKGAGTTALTASATIPASDISSGAALTEVDDTNVTLTLGGSPSTALLAATSITAGWTGQLSVARGGTGAATLTGVVIGNGTSAFTVKTNPTGAFVGTTDTQTLSGKTIERAILNDGYTEEVFAITDGATVNLDPNNGSIQTWTLGANRTPGQANWAAGQSITLMIDDGTARTITWSTLAPVWETNGGTAPTLALTGFTVIVLWKVSTTIYGARVGDA